MCQVSSKNFEWFPAKKLFIAEMSELPDGFRFAQVYPDACDAGFTMLSAASGEEITFVMSSTDRDGGEVAGWRFIPTAKSVRQFPRCSGLSVLIIND